jgi:hypothetical protein
MTDESDSVTSRWWGRRLPRLGVGVLLLLMQSGCMCGCPARHSPTVLEASAFNSLDEFPSARRVRGPSTQRPSEIGARR